MCVDRIVDRKARLADTICFNLRGNEGHENLDGDLSLRSGAQRWPELVIPFEKDNPIKKVILNGWFDTAAGA